jgi:hypothetical protein
MPWMSRSACWSTTESHCKYASQILCIKESNEKYLGNMCIIFKRYYENLVTWKLLNLKGSDDGNTENDWVSGLCPSFGVLNTKKQHFGNWIWYLV